MCDVTEGKTKKEAKIRGWMKTLRSNMKKRGRTRGNTSCSLYCYVICSPLWPPSASSTQSFPSASDRCCLTWPQCNALHHGQCQFRSLCGKKQTPHFHNHDSDMCIQTLCIERSCNIYLCMASSLWIFIAATPPKPIKVCGNKGDVWRLGGKTCANEITAEVDSFNDGTF